MTQCLPYSFVSLATCFPVFAFCWFQVPQIFPIAVTFYFKIHFNRSWFPGRRDNACAIQLAVDLSQPNHRRLTPAWRLSVKFLHKPIKFGVTLVFLPEVRTITVSASHRSLSQVFNCASSHNQEQFRPCAKTELFPKLAPSTFSAGLS